MAIYSFRLQPLERSAGRSVVAAAAYRSGTSLADKRLGQEFDFSAKRGGIEHTAILTPEGTPPELTAREALWNAVEKSDKRIDAVPAREILIALPHELNDQQRRELVEDFARESLVNRGMIADIAIHRPGGEGDERNHHAHIMVTTRDVGPEGFGGKNRDWQGGAFVKDIRREWAEVANRHLDIHAPHVEKISEKSLAAQGVERTPTEHKGPDVTAMERRGERTDRGENNRDIKAENFGREREDQRLNKQVRDSFDAKEWKTRPTDEVIKGMQATRDGMARQCDAWQKEREAIVVPKVMTVRRAEAELAREAKAAVRQAEEREKQAAQASRSNGVSAKQIAFWHSNPAQAAMQHLRGWNADLDRTLKARAETARAKKELHEREAWLKTDKGKAAVQNIRQPDIDAAKPARTKDRTLERKVARMDKRLVEADRAIRDVKVAKRLGQDDLRVPGEVPTSKGDGTAGARRYFKFMSTEARVVIARAPEPQRIAAFKFVKGLAPGAPVPGAPKAGPTIKPDFNPGRPGPTKGPDMPDF